MKIDLLMRGYPSQIRFAEWQKANSLPESELPKLSKEQRARARQLHVSERDYAVAVKAGELAESRALEQMERVARLVGQAVVKRDPEAELTSLVWDFWEHRFEFSTRHRIAGDSHKECLHSIPTDVVDGVLQNKEGAERELKEAVDSELRVLAE